MKTLKIAEKKLSCFDSNVICGYLTQSEVESLIQSGYKLVNSCKWKIDFIKNDLKHGKCFQGWYYFTYPKNRKIEYKNQHNR